MLYHFEISPGCPSSARGLTGCNGGTAVASMIALLYALYLSSGHLGHDSRGRVSKSLKGHNRPETPKVRCILVDQ